MTEQRKDIPLRRHDCFLAKRDREFVEEGGRRGA